MGNNPVCYRDPDGREIKIRVKHNSSIWRWTSVYTWDNDTNCFRNIFGKEISGNKYVDDVTQALKYLKNSETANKLITSLSDIKEDVLIREPYSDKKNSFKIDGNKGMVLFNNMSKLELNDGTGSFNSAALALVHEFIHAEDYYINCDLEILQNMKLGNEFKNASELRAIIKTNIIAIELGEAIRWDYSTAIETGREQGDVTFFINNQ